MTPEFDPWGRVSMVVGLVPSVRENHLWCGTASSHIVCCLHRHSWVLWQIGLCWWVGDWIFVSMEYYLRNGRPSLVLGDDHSHMGGSGDMKSDVVMVAIGDFIFMFLCSDIVLYIEGYFTFYMWHYLGWLVLYPRCRVNRDTNLFVVYDYVILIFWVLLPLYIWASVWRPQPVGFVPTELQSTTYHLLINHCHHPNSEFWIRTLAQDGWF